MSAASLAGILTSSTPLGLILKVTLLLLIALGVVSLMHRRSAAARHFVWALALVSAVMLGALSPLVPAVPLPIAGAPALRDAPPVTFANSEGTGAVVNMRRTEESTTSIVDESVLDALGFSLGGSMLIAAWVLGSMCVIGWLILGHIGLARLTRRATLVVDSQWLDRLADVRAAMSIRRPVRLYSSPAVGAPITWGFARPIVVLPVEGNTWSDTRQRVVLEHELAHVARHDYLMQVIASLACALYWFHPMVWFTARRLRSESERACDDAVLTRGTSGADYASHLLSVASGARALRLTGAVSIGMARSSALEGRLLAALNPSAVRTPVSAQVRRYSTVALGAVLLPLAGLRAIPSAASAVAQPTAGRVDSIFARASAGQRLYLDLRAGGDVEIRGWDKDSVRVRLTLGGRDWRDLLVSLGPTSDGVVLRSWYGRRRDSQSTTNRYEIHVPRRFDVRLSSGGGDLTIRDVEGDFGGTSGGGEIVLERLRGRASLSTGGGDIRVSDVDLAGSVSTGGGKVTLSRVAGGLRGHSGSGPVMYGDKPNAKHGGDTTADISTVRVDKDNDRITLRAGQTAQVSTLHISKAGGDVILDEAPAGAVIHTGGGKVRVGRSAGLVDASTGGGDVTIGPVAGSVIAGTGAGTVTVTLADAGDENQTVEIHAGVGRVILQLPRDFDGTFELETAYTRRFGRATRIESDWRLDEQTTAEWDDREGTPRRYVRANGTVGRGRGRVFIKTTNGDIEVRRAR